MTDEPASPGGPTARATNASSPPAADRATFQAELDALRVREKAHTREGDPATQVGGLDNTGTSPAVPCGPDRLPAGGVHRCPVLDTTVRLTVDRRAPL